MRFPDAPSGRVERTRREAIFSDIYAHNLCGDPESVSGPGSNRARAAAFSAELPLLFDAFGVRTLLDAPCGDFNWMRELPWRLERYVGVDIVSEIVEKNQRAYGSETRSFLHCDLVSDPLPRADAIVCRDGLVHLSLADILRALSNFKRTRAPYLLATTFPLIDENQDIQTGEWRPINLQRPPFNFPVPLRMVDEKRRRSDGTDVGKYLGLWQLDEIAADPSASAPGS